MAEMGVLALRGSIVLDFADYSAFYALRENLYTIRACFYGDIWRDSFSNKTGRSCVFEIPRCNVCSSRILAVFSRAYEDWLHAKAAYARGLLCGAPSCTLTVGIRRYNAYYCFLLAEKLYRIQGIRAVLKWAYSKCIPFSKGVN